MFLLRYEMHNAYNEVHLQRRESNICVHPCDHPHTET